MKQPRVEQVTGCTRAPDEEAIKVLVLRELYRLKQIDAKSIIANEYPLGRLGVRADIAISARKLIGVEIKSAYDSIRRLDRQIGAYQRLFDKVILVVASKHIDGMEDRLPMGVDLWEISDAGCIKKILRASRRSSFGIAYAGFMTKCELGRLTPGSTAIPRKRDFLTAFERKFGKTSESFWNASGINADSLLLLSRFKSRRDCVQRRLKADEARWGCWLEALARNQSLHASSVSYSPELSP